MDLDLSTFLSPDGSVGYDGTALVSSDYGAFVIPAAYISDPSAHYEVTLTYSNNPSDGSFFVYSQISPDLAGYEGSGWYTLGYQNPDGTGTGFGGQPGSGTATILLGPGVQSFHLAAAEGERYLLFYVGGGVRITAISFEVRTLARGEWQSPGAYSEVRNVRTSPPRVVDTESAYGGHGETVTVPAPGEHVPFSAGDLKDGLVNANANNDGAGTILTEIGSYVEVSYTYDEGGIPTGIRRSSLVAQHAFNPRGLVGADSYTPFGMPEGAIGYEWQDGLTDAQHPSRPIGARILGASVVQMWDEDATAAAEIGTPVDSGSVTEVWVNPNADVLADGSLAALPGVHHLENVRVATLTRASAGRLPAGGRGAPLTHAVSELGAVEIDLTEYLPEPDASQRIALALYTRTGIYTPEGYGAGAITFDSGHIARVGGSFTGLLQVEWTFAAPPFRWIFKEPPTTPYRRTSHRHDSLAGGAPRNYPPSRAVQSSNRIGGGYL